MRKKIVAGNWKMNNDLDETQNLVKQILSLMKENSDMNASYTPEVIIAPPFLYLYGCVQETQSKNLFVAAQNCSSEEKGAFTGEVSATMLQSIGVKYIIIGHSERRAYFNETNNLLAKKVKQTLSHGLIPIFCCGELLAEREAGVHFNLVKTQLKEGLFDLSKEDFLKVVIAYEPVWAIGTGVTASPAQAQEMHAHIRQMIKENYGESVAENTSILYGGSCNAVNAKELFSCQDVDGGLIGGASLKSADFMQIVNSF